MKYMILAGETSGDIHGARLITELKNLDSKASFTFTGGDSMIKAAGTDAVIHISDMAFMGFSEVLRNLSRIKDNMRAIKSVLHREKPDALVLIDYPSFNLRLAKEAKRMQVPVFYYISPKVWAWKEHRVAQIKKYVDKVFVIFPFEVSFYKERHDYDVVYVGNPTVEEVAEDLANVPGRRAFLERNSLRDRPIVALLPGSRKGEIRNNLAVMAKTLESFPQYRAVICGAPGIKQDFYSQICDLPVIYGQTVALLKHSVAALVTSGTATLETAVVGTPQVACYRSNGQRIAFEIMKKIIKVPFVTLPNLIANREVIPEMLLHNCTPELIGKALIPLLTPTHERQEMLAGYADIMDRLNTSGSPAANVASLIYNSIK